MSFLEEFNLSVPVFMAPMSGVSSLPFRILNRRYGCEFAFTEMIDIRSLTYFNKKTQEMIRTEPSDRPLGIQIVGNDPYYILKGLEILEGFEFDLLDFNAACPKNKVIKKGQGASLLKYPKKLAELLEIIVKHSSRKVTVKMRLGWDTISKARDIALYAEDTGIDAVIVHGRTKVQDYYGEVNYDVIRKIKEDLKIPVIASGDVFNPLLAKKMFDETGCDGVLVARGVIGNPWIFKGIYELFKNCKIIKKPGVDTVADTMKEHFNLYLDFYDERRSIIMFRKYFMWYTNGFSKVKSLRNKINNTKKTNDIMNLIEEFRSLEQYGR